MPDYRIAFKSSAEKELLQLADDLLARIFPKIEALAQVPRPTGSKKLRGSKDLWRIRIGDYRVVYSIHDDQKEIHITRIAHRRNAYE